MARKSRVTEQQIETARKKIADLPLKDTSKSTREAVGILSKDIQEAINKGYTLNEISNILQTYGISIQTSTLKAYLGRCVGVEKNIANTKNNQMVNISETQIDKDFVKQDTPLDDL